MVFCNQCCSRLADAECTRHPPYCQTCCRYWAKAQPVDCPHQNQPKRARPAPRQQLARKLELTADAKEETKEEKAAPEAAEEKKVEEEAAKKEAVKKAAAKEEAEAEEEEGKEEEGEEEEEEEQEEVVQQQADNGQHKTTTTSAPSSSSSSSSSSSDVPSLPVSSPSSVPSPIVAELIGAIGPLLCDIQLTVNSIAQRLPHAASASATSSSASFSASVTSHPSSVSTLAMTPSLSEVKSMDQLRRALATLLRRTLQSHPSDTKLALAVHGFIVKSMLFAHCASVSTAVRYLNECALHHDPMQGDVYLSAFQSIIRPRLSPAASASISDLLLTADDSDGSDDEQELDENPSSKRRRTLAH